MQQDICPFVIVLQGPNWPFVALVPRELLEKYDSRDNKNWP